MQKRQRVELATGNQVNAKRVTMTSYRRRWRGAIVPLKSERRSQTSW
jgi:hypothetical protein